MKEVEGKNEWKEERKKGGRNNEGRDRKMKCYVLQFCYSKCCGYLNTVQGQYSHKVCIGYNCLLPEELCGRSKELLPRSRN